MAEKKTPLGWEDICGETILIGVSSDIKNAIHNTEDPESAQAFGFQTSDYTVIGYEDQEDGYRSSCRNPIVTKDDLYQFTSCPVYLHVPVVIKKRASPSNDGVEIVDRRNGETILILGTDGTDDYYPWYACQYTPENLWENKDR